jgi:hypothetical protein
MSQQRHARTVKHAICGPASSSHCYRCRTQRADDVRQGPGHRRATWELLQHSVCGDAGHHARVAVVLKLVCGTQEGIGSCHS